MKEMDIFFILSSRSEMRGGEAERDRERKSKGEKMKEMDTFLGSTGSTS